MVKQVVVGIDFSNTSKKALGAAYEWAKRLGVPLTAVHILQPPAPEVGGAGNFVTFPVKTSKNDLLLPEPEGFTLDKQWRADVEAHAMEQLNAWVKDFPGVKVKAVWGGPADGLVREADADTLLVVGSVGHSTFEHLLFGSTAVKVVRHAPCDVLVVRAPGK